MKGWFLMASEETTKGLVAAKLSFLRVSSFVVPKGGGKDEIKLLGTGGCEEIVSLEQY